MTGAEATAEQVVAPSLKEATLKSRLFYQGALWKFRIGCILLGVVRFFCSPFKKINWFLLLGTPIGVRKLSKEEKQTIYPAMRMPTRAPEALHTPIHRNFLPEKCFPEVFVVRLKDAISTSRGYTINSAGELLPETSVEAYFYPLWYPPDDAKESPDLKLYDVWNRRIKTPPTRFRGVVASLTNLWHRGYFHWLFEVLPRFHILESAGIKFDRLYIDSFLLFQKETLNRLGYDEDKLINAATNTCIWAEELIVPSVPGIPGVVPSWACEYLRRKFLPPSTDDNFRVAGNPRLIYISRERARNRRCTNEEEVSGLLKRLGFKCVFLETLRFEEQVELLSQADVVVACHGGGLSNIVFCRPGTVVIEIFSPLYVNPCYWQVSQAVNLKYYYLLGEGAAIIPKDEPWVKGAGPKDITVRIDELTEVVERVLASLQVHIGKSSIKRAIAQC